MARGGSRKSAPGVAHSNRTDMNQAVKTVTGLPYGEAGQLQAAQRAIPLPNNQAVPAANPPQVPSAGPPALPGQTPFDAPTQRPNEPVTAGIPSGPGPGPEALSTLAPANDNVRQTLQALYAQSPNNDLLRLLELHDQGY